MSKNQFTIYQKFVVAILAFLQFTIILDFMIISPLGAILMPALSITPEQFGRVVSAYAFSAGVSGLLSAGFADRFDRKKLLLFFYVGFLLGTFVCGISPTYHILLVARIVTGLFGGVVGSIVLAITADLFDYQQRGRVMGILQTAFGASQILGIPAALYFSNFWGWHAPFLMIVAVGFGVGVLIVSQLRPIKEHLKIQTENSAFKHFKATIKVPRYILAFFNTSLLTTGAYMLMPFGTAFAVYNLKIPFEQLPTQYLITGVAALFLGPLIGKSADRFGKFKVFIFGAAVTIVMVNYYTHLAPTTIWVLTLVQVLFILGIFSRTIPSQALTSALPSPDKRGAFMALNSSLQQIAGGFSALIAGQVVVEASDKSIIYFDRLGYILTGTVLTTVISTWYIWKIVEGKK